MQINNLILNVDSYKNSHFNMYPPDTTGLYGYVESRGGKYPETVFFGLQMFLKEYLSKPITLQDIEEAEKFYKQHGEPFNKDGWLHILNKHKGFMPVRIRAVPEGTVVPVQNVLVTVESTDPKVFWIASFIETMLLRGIWYPTTIATLSWNIKKTIKQYLELTSDSFDNLPFGLLDFSARGCSSFESNAIGGTAHLLSFMGTDSVSAVKYAMDMYNAEMPGFSVPATEHSVMCSWGQERELESFKHMIDAYPEFSIISVVSDTWNIFEAVEKWNQLADYIKQQNKTLVVRPDGGDPAVILPQLYSTLEDGFGYTVNSKGYKILNNVKLLWGDGIEPATVATALEAVRQAGYSTETVLLGSGGGLLQKVNRDTCKFAFKASAVKVDEMWKDIFKAPVTDLGKTSKKGKVTLYKDATTGQFYTGILSEKGVTIHGMKDELVTVFENGKLLVDWTFDEIKQQLSKF